MINIQNLKKDFGKKTVFDAFSFTFPDKGSFAVMGESGVGKTTLLRIIAGLDTKFGGSVSGVERGGISYAFQEHRLFPLLTALQNVTVSVDKPTEADEARAASLLLSLGLSAEDLTLFPSELSGGMKQRVSIARAIFHKTPVLLLDEPTKELDSENAALVLDAIKKESEERLVITVTHSAEDAARLGAQVIRL